MVVKSNHNVGVILDPFSKEQGFQSDPIFSSLLITWLFSVPPPWSHGGEHLEKEILHVKSIVPYQAHYEMSHLCQEI